MRFVLFLLLATLSLPAQTAESILDRYTAVTGGEAAYRAITSQYAEIEMEVPGQPKFHVVIRQTAGGEGRSKTTMADGSSEESGFFQGVAWNTSSEGDAKILAGAERASEIEDNVLFNHELWRDRHSKAELLGKETLRGEECHKIRLTPKNAVLKSSDFWFSVKTGLLVKMQAWEIEDGEWSSFDSWLLDYRKVPAVGVVFPFRVEIELGGATVRGVFSRMEFNRKFTPAEIAYPPSIAKLVPTARRTR